ncbi:MAG: hypothetical protein HKN68_22755, partial [Saprospiraceae bacterium]|nr:hypothetical protein [Saprospiraceae bacterium]
VDQYGADGKMVFGNDDKLLKATLTEKLLVTLLAKLTNFIPEGGIWLNTQRPEWNDANNALVGNGVSMVTLYYIRRYLTFCIELFGEGSKDQFEIHTPVSNLLNSVSACFNDNQEILIGSVSNNTRKSIMDSLGRAGEVYREKGYSGFADSGSSTVDKIQLVEFFELARKYVDHSIRANKRSDGLYHSYNLVQIKGDEASIEYLYEMLEGQVSVLSAGLLSGREALEVLDALKESKIYREDQYSYLLYPDRELPRFLEKNNIPNSFIESSNLAQTLLQKGDITLISKDLKGNYHFNGSFTNANGLRDKLEELKDDYADLVENEYEDYLEVFETMFNHKAFTGRSGTFYGYEGLGSIYWHMVSKLLLVVQENIFKSISEGEDEAVIKRLKEHYYDVREGIGVHKSPSLYGAFPTDPYSHTPANKGAQQPGMTGQVKEDVMNRWAELGIRITAGRISFNPIFLKNDEFLSNPDTFEYFNVEGERENLNLDAGELAFTYCQVPVIFKRGTKDQIQLTLKDGATVDMDGLNLPEDESGEIFKRSGKIRGLNITLNY